VVRWWFFLVICLGLLFYGFGVSAQTASGYDALVHQGNAQLQAHNNDLALATANSAIKEAPDRWEAYALAGGALMNLKRYEEAADRFSKAIEPAPESKQAGLRDLRRQCLLAESGPAPADERGIAPATTSQAEIVLWKTIENSSNPDDFEAYLRQYPSGAFAGLARDRLEKANTLRQMQEARAEMARKAGNTYSVRTGFGLDIEFNVHSGGVTYREIPKKPKPTVRSFVAACSEVTDVRLTKWYLTFRYSGVRFEFLNQTGETRQWKDSDYHEANRIMFEDLKRQCP